MQAEVEPQVQPCAARTGVRTRAPEPRRVLRLELRRGRASSSSEEPEPPRRSRRSAAPDHPQVEHAEMQPRRRLDEYARPLGGAHGVTGCSERGTRRPTHVIGEEAIASRSRGPPSCPRSPGAAQNRRRSAPRQEMVRSRGSRPRARVAGTVEAEELAPHTAMHDASHDPRAGGVASSVRTSTSRQEQAASSTTRAPRLPGPLETAGSRSLPARTPSRHR